MAQYAELREVGESIAFVVRDRLSDDYQVVLQGDLTWEIWHKDIEDRRVGGFEFHQAWYRLDAPSGYHSTCVGIPSQILEEVRSVVREALQPVQRQWQQGVA